MSASLDQIAAEVAEIKAMLRQLLAGGAVESPPPSPIMETLRAAEALGIDPVKAMEQHRVVGSRGRKKCTTTKRRSSHV